MSDWRERASCQDKPDLFHPPGADWKGHAEQASQAIAVCRTCPSRTLCLEWALEVNDKFAILGGTTPEQRDRMRRNRKRESRAQDAGAA